MKAIIGWLQVQLHFTHKTFAECNTVIDYTMEEYHPWQATLLFNNYLNIARFNVKCD